MQFTAVRARSHRTDHEHWSSLNRSGRPRPELPMRFGFAPIRGSNPRASAREQAPCRSGKVPVPMQVIIKAPGWHSLGTLSDRSASEDAIDHRAANAGEPLHPVLAEAGRDGSTHTPVPITARHRAERAQSLALQLCPGPRAGSTRSELPTRLVVILAAAPLSPRARRSARSPCSSPRRLSARLRPVLVWLL